jgi:hypothetical protein
MNLFKKYFLSSSSNEDVALLFLFRPRRSWTLCKNGSQCIEYALMELIAEAYDLMRKL